MLEKHCFLNGNRVYHISIIDYLQTWNLQKKLERLTKTVFLGKDAQTTIFCPCKLKRVKNGEIMLRQTAGKCARTLKNRGF